MRLSFFSIRAAQEAQVIPPIASSIWLVAVDNMLKSPLAGRHRELGGANLATVLEVEVEPVVTGRRDVGVEYDVGPGRGLAVGMHVQVRQVAVAQRDEVPVGA